ncbi:hypothetical protein PPACK8108_LOCUS15378 [Phakopsora pachyrhizi]|uniref:Uncharacterized protein n=1 Tax=Phakopsora pachyrhizi TaxID=170000 RepID=A0AAV0B637_PHAPC|nr:hypothetical protein PPACK8108_LOCUS15378 [Phakopsora pachyrhizi]
MERLGYEFQDKDQQIVRKKEERARSPDQVWNYLNQSDRLSLTGRSLSVKPYLGSGYSILSEPLMINKLIETLTSLIGNVRSSSGRPRPACLPDPTKKRRNSRTIDQELKLPKNESSSSGLDDQQTENATEETTLIPQIKKGVHKVLITSTPYTTYCALLLYIYSKLWKDNLTIVITRGTLPRSPQLYCVYAIPRPGVQFRALNLFSIIVFRVAIPKERKKEKKIKG